MREIVHIQAGQCGNQIGTKVNTIVFLYTLFFYFIILQTFRKKTLLFSTDIMLLFELLLLVVVLLNYCFCGNKAQLKFSPVIHRMCNAAVNQLLKGVAGFVPNPIPLYVATVCNFHSIISVYIYCPCTAIKTLHFTFKL